MEGMIIFGMIVFIAVVLLKGFDVIAGRGPTQVHDGINRSNIGQSEGGRVPCPQCSELVLLDAKKCPFCRSWILAELSSRYGCEVDK